MSDTPTSRTVNETRRCAFREGTVPVCEEVVKVKVCQVQMFGAWKDLPQLVLCKEHEALHREQQRLEDEAEDARQLAAREQLYSRAVPLIYRQEATWDGVPAQLRQRLQTWDGRSWLFLNGGTGTGKSSAAALVAYMTVMRGEFKKLAWANVAQALEQARRNIRRNDNSDLLAQLLTADLAVLDDLGAEKPSEWVASRLYEIISTRYDNLRPTIITSNLTLDQISDRLNPSEGEPYGERTASRLAKVCQQITLGGADRRLA